MHDDNQKPSVHGPQTFEKLNGQHNGAQAVRQPTASRTVQKPVPKAQLENPRDFQLGQVRRRYKPKENQDAHGSAVLAIKIIPSDPDFPFEMAALECSLVVPQDYPTARPSIKVRNTDIPRGFAINIEHGFDRLAEKKGSTLLALMSALDRNLESLLSEKKTETVKLVANADKRHIVDLPVRMMGSSDAIKSSTAQQSQATAKQISKPEPTYTSEQKREASERRELEIRQLEARLGRMPLFKKSSDGIEYTIPIEPRRRQGLPPHLQAIKTIKLFVPLLYPLQPCRLQIEGSGVTESKAVEAAFAEKAKASPQTTLMAHINYFAQNMHTMVKSTEVATPKAKPIEDPSVAPPELKSLPVDDGKDRRLEVIPRPPEFDLSNDEDDSEGDYTYDSGDESSEVGEDEALTNDNETSNQPTQTAERGTAISFPFIELYGIELLEVTTLNITIKCERCKETNEATSLKHNTPKTQSCRKCAITHTITYRRDLIHANAVRAGFLDLTSCSVTDMLPSTFTPTCSKCSTSHTPGLVSIRSEPTSNICQHCHSKFSFLIPEIRFLRISSTHSTPTTHNIRRKKETLGLINGTELPRRGRCKHYSKSLRWFRFSCCQKVYACDRCHDESEEHVNEHANRMICGFCSREQNYRPDDCAVCHGVLVGKKSGGFWEGGKGTRDRVRMSRKDKRKFRRVGGSKS